MGNFATKLKHASPAILTCFSIVGLFGTAIMAVKETPKAMRMVKAKKDELEKEELTPVELVQTTWQCYIPSALIGIGTIACIAGIGGMSKCNQAALTSAYAMINESYKHYKEAAKKVYGEEADHKIQAKMANDVDIYSSDWGYQVYNKSMDSTSEELLFYDISLENYFNSTMAAVLNAQYHVNRNLAIRGDCPLNEYLTFLGLEEVEHGYEMGWSIANMVEEYDSCWLDFDNHKEILDDGLECIIINPTLPMNKFT